MPTRLQSLIPALGWLVIGTAGLQAQPTFGSLTGLVIDSTQNYPLPGAVVRLVGTDLEGEAGLDGRYHIARIPTGSYDIQVSLTGFNPVSEGDVMVSGEVTQLFMMSMHEVRPRLWFRLDRTELNAFAAVDSFAARTGHVRADSLAGESLPWNTIVTDINQDSVPDIVARVVGDSTWYLAACLSDGALYGCLKAEDEECHGTFTADGGKPEHWIVADGESIFGDYSANALYTWHACRLGLRGGGDNTGYEISDFCGMVGTIYSIDAHALSCCGSIN